MADDQGASADAVQGVPEPVQPESSDREPELESGLQGEESEPAAVDAAPADAADAAAAPPVAPEPAAVPPVGAGPSSGDTPPPGGPSSSASEMQQQHEEEDQQRQQRQQPQEPLGGMDPDHPLLARAQLALKAQLEARRAQLEGELKEKRNALKVRRVARPTVPGIGVAIRVLPHAGAAACSECARAYAIPPSPRVSAAHAAAPRGRGR